MRDLTLGEAFELWLDKAVREREEEERKLVAKLNQAIEKITDAEIPNPKKITSKEADTFPTFSNHIEMATFFRKRYGDRFVVVDIVRFDESDTYNCDLIFDPGVYYALEEKARKEDETGDGFDNFDEELAYLRSFQRIEIYSTGEFMEL